MKSKKNQNKLDQKNLLVLRGHCHLYYSVTFKSSIIQDLVCVFSLIGAGINVNCMNHSNSNNKSNTFINKVSTVDEGPIEKDEIVVDFMLNLDSKCLTHKCK